MKDSVEKRLVEELETITHYNQLMREVITLEKIEMKGNFHSLS